MTRLEAQPRLFNRNFVLYLSGWAITAFAYTGVMGVLFNLYLLRLGFGAEFIGALTGSGQLAWALCALPLGIYVRRFGLRVGLVTSALVQSVAIAALLSVEMLPREMWPAWLFGWWIMSWIGASAHGVSGAPLMMQVSPIDRRREAFTVQALMLGIVAFAGSVAAGQLPAWLAPLLNAGVDQPGPYRAAMLGVPVAFALAVPIWWRLKVSPVLPLASREGHEPRPTRLLAALAGMVFLQAAAENGLRTFFNVYLDRQLLTPVPVIGLIGAVAQATSVASALLIPTVLKRAGNVDTLRTISLCVAVCMAVLALGPPLAIAAAGYVLVTALVGIAAQARQLFSQEMVAPHWRTIASSLNNVGVGMGWSAAAGLGGLVVGVAGFAGVFGIGSGLSLAAALSLATFSAQRRRMVSP